jgi:hypothetical protein
MFNSDFRMGLTELQSQSNDSNNLREDSLGPDEEMRQNTNLKKFTQAIYPHLTGLESILQDISKSYIRFQEPSNDFTVDLSRN